MNDFEARLRNSLRYNLDPIDATRQLPDDVASKARARRFIMMVGTGMVVVLLGASTVWTASILSSNPSQLPVAPAPSESPQEARTTHTNEDDGFSITTPEDWSVRWAAPGQSPAMYVSTFDFDLSHGFCGADGPLSILPGDGAFFWLYEIRGLSAPQRPIHFELDESSLASYEGSGCVPTYRIDFSDSGRDFSVHAAFGDQAGQDLRQQVLEALNFLEVSEHASEELEAPCEPADEPSYGKTIPGKWLENVFVELGAPGGHEISRPDIRDTGTALWIDIPAYEDGATIYATMLAMPVDPNEDWEAPEREIGRHGEYRITLTEGDFAWESYQARSEDWQLALIAYPGKGNDTVEWPQGTVEWIERVVEVAEESPPRC